MKPFKPSDLPARMQQELAGKPVLGHASFAPHVAPLHAGAALPLRQVTQAKKRGGAKDIKKRATLARQSQINAWFQSERMSYPTHEHKFHPTRKWRFDLAFIEEKVAIEVDGGVWTGGRHTRGAGFIKDREKGNAAVLLGWKVFYVQPNTLMTPGTADMIRWALKISA